MPRCLPPSEYGVAGYFASADCTGGEGGAFSCPFVDGCPEPALAVDTSSAEPCEPPSPRLFALGAAVPSYSREGPLCVEAIFGVCRFHPVGAEVSATGFPELADGTLGTGRLRALVRTAPDDARPLLTRNLFRDTDTGEICAQVEFEGDVLRCLSIDARPVNPGLTIYADPSCTIRVVAGVYCRGAPAYALEMDQPEGVVVTGAPVRAIHRVGAAHTGETFRREADACVRIGPASDQWIVEDATIAPSAFAVLTERIE